jgi:hypothetical protein
MGNQLAHHAVALMMDGTRTKGLTQGARLTLLAMALSAHDTGTKRIPPAYYYRGWRHLGMVLGHDTWDRTAEQAVTRAVRQLTQAGLIERDDSGKPADWHARGYRLTL